jgi:hypothetical protein
VPPHSAATAGLRKRKRLPFDEAIGVGVQYRTDSGRGATHHECYQLANESEEKIMNDETFNLSMRKFLKMVGVSSQNEIEKAVAVAIANKSLSGSETLPAAMTLEIAGINLHVKFDGNIVLE